MIKSLDHPLQCILGDSRRFKHSHLVFLRIHSSSAKSQAELRFSGSHCNIFRMKRRNSSRSSLSSSPFSTVSRSCKVLVAGKGIPAENSPLVDSVSAAEEMMSSNQFTLV